MRGGIELKLVFILVALALLGAMTLETTLAKWSPTYARTLSLFRLRARRRLLAPTRPDVEGTKATYRTRAEESFVDLARFPRKAALPNSCILYHYPGRAEWLAVKEHLPGQRYLRRVVWIGLSRSGDELRLVTREMPSLLRLLAPFAVPSLLAMFTTASFAIVVGSIPLVLLLSALMWMDARADHEKLANDALDEIEDALADMDGGVSEDDEAQRG